VAAEPGQEQPRRPRLGLEVPELGGTGGAAGAGAGGEAGVSLVTDLMRSRAMDMRPIRGVIYHERIGVG